MAAFIALLASQLLRSALCLDHALPTQTAFADDGADILGFTPKPTTIPGLRGLLRRDDPVPSGTCGYVTNDEHNSLTCPNGLYCGVRYDWNVMGCCSQYSKVGTSYTMTGCHFKTACVASAALGDCDADCLANTHNTICDDPTYPYCMSYSYTDVGYSILYCDKYPGIVTYCGETYAGEFTTTTSNTPAYTTPTTITDYTPSATNAVTSSSEASTPITITADETSSTSPSTTATSASSSETSSFSQTASSTTNNAGAGPAPVTSAKGPSASNSDVQSSSSTSGNDSGTSGSSSKNIGTIVGGIVGGLAVIAAAAGIAIFFCFRRLKRKNESVSRPMSQAPSSQWNAGGQQSLRPSSPTITSPASSYAGLAAGQGQRAEQDYAGTGLHPVDPNQQIRQSVMNPYLVSPQQQQANGGWQYAPSPQQHQHEMPVNGQQKYPTNSAYEVEAFHAGRRPPGLTELPG